MSGFGHDVVGDVGAAICQLGREAFAGGAERVTVGVEDQGRRLPLRSCPPGKANGSAIASTRPE